MLVNGKEYNVDDLVKDINLEKDFLKRRENGLLLNDRQVEVLKRNHINYLEYANLSSLLFAINEYMSEDMEEEDVELEQVTQELEEIHYYQETRK